VARRSANLGSGSGGPKTLDPLEKIARLLAMLLVKDKTTTVDQVALLRTAGFQPSEVAMMLGITENHVRVAAFSGRKRAGRKKASRTTERGK
jgi:DNA-directed RNA polymerase specialized sigma24 family protein